MTLRDISVVLGFKTEGEDKLDKVSKQLEGIKHRLDFLAAYEVGKKLFELTERFSRFGEELHLAATSAGLTVEQFQKLSFSASQAGVSQEEMQTSMFRLSKALFAARQGSAEAQRAFALVGIDSDQVAGFKNSNEALLAIADRFKNIQDPIQKSALALELMGRGSRNMVGYLSQGGAAIKSTGDEASRLGLILGKGQVEALVNAEHALNRFWTLIKAIGATIAAQVAPALTQLIDEFIKFFAANRKIIEINLEKWLYNVTFAMGAIWEAVKIVTEVLLKFAHAWGFDKNILSIVFSIGTLVTGLMIALRVFSFFGPAIKLFTGAFSLLGRAIITIIPWLWGLVAPAVAAAAPFLGWAAAIGAVVVGLHDLFALMSGKETWTGQAFKWVKGGVGNLFGAGKEAGASIQDRLGALGGLTTALPSSSSTNAQSNANYSVNAPININVPPGTPPGEVGKSVQDGIKNHFERILRETKRSTSGAVAY